MKFLYVLSLATLFAGCSMIPSVGPDYEPPQITMPANWSEVTAASSQVPPAEDTEKWWTVFKDKDLDLLIAKALENNRDLKVAEATVTESDQLREIAAAGFLPSTTLSFDQLRRKFSQNSFQGFQAQGGNGRPGISLINNQFSGVVSTSWELDLFGGLRRGYEAADALYEATEDRLHATQISLLASVVTTYFEVRANEKRIAIAHRNVATQEKTLDIITKWRDAGLSSSLDVAQTEAQYQQTKATIPTLEGSYADSRNRLAVLLGVFPQELDILLPKQDLAQANQVAPKIPELVLAGVPSDLLRNRPDVRAAERELAAATAQIGVSVANIFPKFKLTADIGLLSIKRPTFFEAASQAWNVNTGMSWPIFSAYQLLTKVRADSALAEQAAASYEQVVLNALAEGETSLTLFDNEKERLGVLAEANKAANEAVRLSDQQYQAGLIDLLRVLEAQRSAFVTEDALAVSEQRIATSLVSSYKALGFGWKKKEEGKAA